MLAALQLSRVPAVVIGSGSTLGLGKEHAIYLAARGAKLVVNDIGGSFKGEGSSKSPADHVVDEIVAAGGEAVANYDSVESGSKILDTAIEAYGRVDIIVNNAGYAMQIKCLGLFETGSFRT